MATNGTLGTVYTQVTQAQTDAATVVNDAVAVASYAASTYPGDTQLRQLVDNVNADANTVVNDLQPLTTDQAQPPKA